MNEGRDERPISWDWGNEVLYRMCREEPGHTDVDIIAAKLWLIGRSYAAQIERRSGERGESDALYADAARLIKASHLDEWMNDVSQIRRLDSSNIGLALAVHSRLVKLLHKCTRLNRRSFASKYLHFHTPTAFFIFDSRASAAIRQKVKRRRVTIPPSCAESDLEYAAFVLRCILYRDEMPGDLTPRQIDAELLGYRCGEVHVR